MSGGGSSISFERPTAPPTGPGGPDKCQGISIPTTLASPIIAALASVSIGELLPIILASGVRALVAINSTGQVCGSIVVEPARLLACIDSGVDFVARVTGINGAQCSVTVQNA